MGKSARKSFAVMKESRQKALRVTHALDHMLQSLGLGLATFATAGASRSRPLSSSEDRLEVPVAVPDSVDLPPGVKPCRIFARGRVTRATRWEAPAFQGD